MLKIIVDKPADKGNVFLCPKCEHSNTRGSSESNTEYWCGRAEFCKGGGYSSRITSEITNCNMYQPKDLWDNEHSLPKVMKQQAYYILASREQQGRLVLVSYLEKTRLEGDD